MNNAPPLTKLTRNAPRAESVRSKGGSPGNRSERTQCNRKYELEKNPMAGVFECLLGEEVVSWLGVDDRLMRIGSQALKMGGISGVGTLRRHRHRG